MTPTCHLVPEAVNYSTVYIYVTKPPTYTKKHKILLGWESNPGLLCDRQRYSPLYYQGLAYCLLLIYTLHAVHIYIVDTDETIPRDLQKLQNCLEILPIKIFGNTLQHYGCS